MARKKCKGTELSVFKGRETKLNRAIIQTLVGKNAKTIWEIKKQITTLRDLKKTRYHNINTRVRALESKGYLRRVGERENKAGGTSILYEATAKASFVLLMDSLCLDQLINELDEVATLTITSVIATSHI